MARRMAGGCPKCDDLGAVEAGDPPRLVKCGECDNPVSTLLTLKLADYLDPLEPDEEAAWGRERQEDKAMSESDYDVPQTVKVADLATGWLLHGGDQFPQGPWGVITAVMPDPARPGYRAVYLACWGKPGAAAVCHFRDGGSVRVRKPAGPRAEEGGKS